MPEQNPSKTHVGTCHCGAVRFQFKLEPSATPSRCNCTICRRTGQTGAIIKPAAFQLLAGAENLSQYEWGAKVSARSFCKTCGVFCFGRGHMAELGGDYVSVNLNCVDDLELDEAKIAYWDGRHNNWHAGPRSEPWPVTRPAST